MYICEYCNYKTEYSSNYCIHKKSKKHLKNIAEKSDKMTKKQLKYPESINEVSDEYPISDTIKNIVKYNCENCGTNFTHKNNYYRHRKNCQKKDNPDLMKELIETKLKLEYTEKEKELLQKIEKEKSEMLNTFMANANTLLNKASDNTKVTAEAMKSVSMSALKYANEKFKNTPAMLPLENFNINNLDFSNEENKAQLVEILIYNAKQKSLDKLLGDHIVKEYKKNNPEEQTFHATDCSRLNYIIRELIDNALIWSIDKNGIKICSSIVKPLINKCINALMEHQKYLLQEMSKGDLYRQKDVELIIDVIMSIDSGSLETEINKYIAPFFNLNKSTSN